MPSQSPGQTSVTRAAPAAVPSVRQSSRPCAPSLAAKYTRPPNGTRFVAPPEPPEPPKPPHPSRQTSASRRVLAGSPLVTQSDRRSPPPSAAGNRRRSPRTWSWSGSEYRLPNGSSCAKSVTRCVPAAVPSLVHSSEPCASLATKKIRSPTALSQYVEEKPPRGKRATLSVPAWLPSLVHSSSC